MIEVAVINDHTLINLEGNPGFKGTSKEMMQHLSLQLILPVVMGRDRLYLSAQLKAKISCVLLTVPEDSTLCHENPENDMDEMSARRQRCAACMKVTRGRKEKNNLPKYRLVCSFCKNTVCKGHSDVLVTCSTCKSTSKSTASKST